MKTGFFDIENWREIGQTLARNKTRTFLTAFGIFWGTAMLAMLWGGAGGVEGMMRRNFDGFSTNMGAVFPGMTSMPYRGFPKGMYWQLREDDIEGFRRSVSEIDLSSAITNQYGTGKYSTKSQAGQIMGVEPDFYNINLPVIHAGRVINDNDNAGSRKVMVMGLNIAQKFFGSEPEAAIGKFIELNGVYFQVIGVVSQKSQASIGGQMQDSYTLPLNTMRRLYNTGDSFGFFIYTTKPGTKPSEVVPSFRRIITRNHPIHPDDEKAIESLDVSEMFEMVDNLFSGINLLALFVGIGTLLAGIIGVGNIMWIIVKERTHEIGIRRAIGAKPTDVIMQILSESVVLTVIAGVAGIVFGVVILGVTDKFTADPLHGPAGFQLPFAHAMAILVAFLVLGTAAGIIPALKAMKIKPIEAINDK